MSKTLRSALQRLGSASPVVLGSAYALSALVVAGIASVVPRNVAGLTFIMILHVIVVSLLFVTVTWFRDDDWLAAGVLMTLIVYIAVAVLGLLAVVFRGGIGPAAIWGAVTAGWAIIYAIIFAPIAGGFVALARRLTREQNRSLL